MKPAASSPARIPFLSFLLLLLFFLAIVAAARTKWPELVGKFPEEAKKVIKKDMPAVKIQIVKYGEAVTQDFSPTRVRLFLNVDGRIAYPPVIG